eukprot:6248278-Karenia_brevis.AAC.1
MMSSTTVVYTSLAHKKDPCHNAACLFAQCQNRAAHFMRARLSKQERLELTRQGAFRHLLD